ncbi:replicative DNA helicase [Nocardia harenae]|uniref:replicative DNA helicase n=1 Tax=Nocardia harenae TaxID=358707 RepID=UPI0008302A7A|nr:replicative DNA helicase [Nocardia harenae]
MAVVDDRGHAEYPPDAPGEDFGRQPPHDMAAEQSVLGGMLLSKDAIADVVEVIRPGDFYRPAHQAIYDAVLDLYGRGEPADPVTVSAALDRRGELKRIGGPPYLVTLTQTVPTAANAGYYAEIVAEKAVLRRLVEAGTRIVQYGYAGADGQDVAEVVDRAQAEVYEVTERRTTEDFLPLEELLQPTMDEIDSIASRGGISLGVPTGFSELDEVTNGLHPGQMIIVAARPGVGKALALDTPLPTPTGWTTMGEVRAGDLLLDADGRPTRVVAATEVLHGRPCYEVEFSDGTVLVADEQHQWLTDTRASRRSRRTPAAVRTTAQIAATLRCETADRRINHSIRTTRPLDLPAADLPVPPYTLGAWLGDGSPDSATRTSADPEIAVRIEGEGLVRTCGGRARFVSAPVAAPACPQRGGPSIGLRLCQGCRRAVGSVQARLRTLGVLNAKHIPGPYLRGSEAQRRALLAGLLDTNGTVTSGGSVQFSAVDERLAADVRELVVSLGYRVRLSTGRADGRTEQSSTASILTFATDDEVFGLHRKALLHKQRRAVASSTRSECRYIVDVRPIPSVPVRCVEVDNTEHLYLAGRAMVPTHNSTLGMDFMRSCSIKNGLASVIFSLEMSRTEIVMRLLSAEAKIKLGDMRSGRMSDDDWTKLARRMSEISEAPLFVDDSPNLTMMEIRAKARRLKQRHDLKLVVVDYLQLMTSGKKVESRQQEVSDFSRNLKLLAKELEVPVVAISQLNRGPEQRTDKRPMVSDLRESGCLPASARVLRADTGAESTLGELLESGEQPLVWSLDERMRMVARPMVKVFPSGRKEVFRLRLASGREVEATGNHPFLTVDGWIPLDRLGVGDRLATPRLVPEPVHTERMPDAEVVLLAHMIGDGSCVRRQPVRYASIDEENLAAVSTAAEHFGVAAVRDDYPAARVTTLRLRAPYRLTRGKRNPIAEWLDGLGLFGLRSYEKFVPARIFALPTEQVALFLRHLWATDGSVRWDEKGNQARVYYASTSRRLVDDVAQLLLRVGVHGRIKQVRKPDYRPCWHLTVDGSENQTIFLRDVGVHGARGVAAERTLEQLAPLARNTNVDTVPKEIWSQVKTLLATKEMTHREFASAMNSRFCGSTMWKRSPSRSRLARVANVLQDADIEMFATNDVFWDRVVDITSLGEQDVFDGTVPGTHNFVANGVALHNSLEQDADMVILLHRPDAFERDDPRGGEADLILGKHRNGPTATITVAHQLHLSRFVDMARG